MILFARNRLRALIVLFFAHDMHIQVAHALCKQGCRLISYTAYIRRVTIATCYNCPRSPLHVYYKYIILIKSVCLSVLPSGMSQFLLDHLGRYREISQTVRIDRRYILSRVRLSVRPSNFVSAKNIQNLEEIGSPACVFI